MQHTFLTEFEKNFPGLAAQIGGLGQPNIEPEPDPNLDAVPRIVTAAPGSFTEQLEKLSPGLTKRILAPSTPQATQPTPTPPGPTVPQNEVLQQNPAMKGVMSPARPGLGERFTEQVATETGNVGRWLAKVMTPTNLQAMVKDMPREQPDLPPAEGFMEHATDIAGRIVPEIPFVAATAGIPGAVASKLPMLGRIGSLFAGEAAQSGALFGTDLARGMDPADAAINAVAGTGLSMAGRMVADLISQGIAKPAIHQALQAAGVPEETIVKELSIAEFSSRQADEFFGPERAVEPIEGAAEASAKQMDAELDAGIREMQARMDVAPASLADEPIGGGQAATPPGGAPAKAGNINLERIEATPGAVEQIEKQQAMFGADMSRAKRSIQSMAYIEARAEQMALDPVAREKLYNKPIGSAYSAEEVQAVRRVNVTAAERASVAQRAYDANPSQGNLDELSNAFLEHTKTQLTATAAAGEAGRALRVHQAAAKALQINAPLLSQAQKNAVVAELKRTGRDPEGIEAIIKKASDPTFLDKLHEVRLASMLSSAVGRSRDAIGSAWNTAIDRPLQLALTGRLQDAWKHYAGVSKSMSEAGQTFIKTWKAGKTQLGGPESGPIGGLLRPTAHGQRYAGTTYERKSAIEAITTPGLRQVAMGLKKGSLDIVQSIDDYFKILSAGGEANRIAGHAGRTMEAELANPSKELVNRMNARALITTFQDDNAVTQYVSKLRSIPGGRWVAPFVRTQANVAKWLAEREPVTGTAIMVGKRLAGLNKSSEGFKDEIAKPLIGILLYGTMAPLLMKGLATGSTPGEGVDAEKARSAGWQPYSIKVGDKYYSVERFHFGLAIGLAQSIMNSIDQKSLTSAMRAYYDLVIDPGWVEATGRFFDAISRDVSGKPAEERALAYVQDVVLSFIPAVARFAADIEERLVTEGPIPRRQEETFLDRIKNRMPGGFRQDVPERKDKTTRKVIEDARSIPGLFVGTGTRINQDILGPIIQSGQSSQVNEELRKLGWRGAAQVDDIDNVFRLKRRSPDEILEKTGEMLATLKQEQLPSGREQKQEIGALSGEQRLGRLPEVVSSNTLQEVFKIRALAYLAKGDSAGWQATIRESKQYGGATDWGALSRLYQQSNLSNDTIRSMGRTQERIAQ